MNMYLAVTIVLLVGFIVLHKKIKKSLNETVASLKEHNQRHLEAVKTAAADVKSAASQVRAAASSVGAAAADLRQAQKK